MEISDIVIKYLEAEHFKKGAPLILKSDNRIPKNEFINVISACSSAGYSVTTMSGSVNASEDECSNIPFEVFMPKDYFGRVFSFDSSVSIYIAALYKAELDLPTPTLVQDLGEEIGSQFRMDLVKRYGKVIDILHEQKGVEAEKVLTLSRLKLSTKSQDYDYKEEWLPREISYS